MCLYSRVVLAQPKQLSVSLQSRQKFSSASQVILSASKKRQHICMGFMPEVLFSTWRSICCVVWENSFNGRCYNLNLNISSNAGGHLRAATSHINRHKRGVQWEVACQKTEGKHEQNSKALRTFIKSISDDAFAKRIIAANHSSVETHFKRRVSHQELFTAMHTCFIIICFSVQITT